MLCWKFTVIKSPLKWKIFTLLGSRALKLFQLSKLRLFSLNTDSPTCLTTTTSPTLFPLENDFLLSVAMILTTLYTSYNWNHTAYVLYNWPVMLSIMSSRFFHFVACNQGSPSFLRLRNSIPRTVYHMFFIQSSIDRLLGCFCCE